MNWINWYCFVIDEFSIFLFNGVIEGKYVIDFECGMILWLLFWMVENIVYFVFEFVLNEYCDELRVCRF